MRNFIRALFLIITFIGSNVVLAGTTALGFEIGVTTLDQVKSTVGKRTAVVDGGINKFSQGPMLKTDGSSYEIDGLRSVLYIFDTQKKLAAIIMNMDKSRFDHVYNALSGKYKVSSQQRPFVGNQFARFKTADAQIDLDAPHMSFEMEVRYVRADLMQKFTTQSAAEADEKRKREAAQF